MRMFLFINSRRATKRHLRLQRISGLFIDADFGNRIQRKYEKQKYGEGIFVVNSDANGLPRIVKKGDSLEQ